MPKTPLGLASLLTLGLLVGCGQNDGQYRPLSQDDVDQNQSTEKSDENTEPDTAHESDSAIAKPAADSLAEKSSTSAGDEAETQITPVGTKPAAESTASVAAMPAGAAPSANATTAAQESASTAAPASPVTPLSNANTKPLEIKLLVPHKEFAVEGKDKALRVNFDDLDLLKVCNMEPVPPNVLDYVPDWLKDLNGKKIILRGWMFPAGRQDGISSFMFVRDNGICCFGRDPKVYDKLAVTMQPGKTTRYIAGRPFDVEATFFLEPDIEGSEEGLWWLYRLEGARVIDQ